MQQWIETGRVMWCNLVSPYFHLLCNQSVGDAKSQDHCFGCRLPPLQLYGMESSLQLKLQKYEEAVRRRSCMRSAVPEMPSDGLTGSAQAKLACLAPSTQPKLYSTFNADDQNPLPTRKLMFANEYQVVLLLAGHVVPVARCPI
jgi:hypothetical protein